MILIAMCLLVFFLATALLHFYWAAGNQGGMGAAVPHVGDKPLFVPSRLSTIAVGIALLGMGAMVLWRINAISLPFPHVWSTVGTSLIATAFTLRAVGEFKYVGFFKRVRDTKFARMDTRFYSPLCLGVAIGLWLLVLI
jgi:Protein of unknown function (DUF3995)